MDGSAVGYAPVSYAMPARAIVKHRALSPAMRGLDWFNFLIANVQTGFGPFIAVYLTAQHWTQVDIGIALSIGTIVSAASQIPAGALVDHLRSKRLAALAAVLAVAASALMFALYPARLAVYSAEALHGFASCVLSPAIAAMSLAVVGRAGLGNRLGRNARFASVGNGLAAAAMGAIGFYFTSGSVFWLTAVLAFLALLPLRAIGPAQLQITPDGPARTPRAEILGLVTNRRLLAFGAAAFLFHLSNAAMLPLAAARATEAAGDTANLIIAAAIVLPQAVVALCSPWVGRTADQGRWRLVLVLGWGSLPVCGLLLAALPGTWEVIGIQAISGIGGAVFGVMMPLACAEITRGTNRFNLAMGAVGLAMFGGATISTTVAGWLADTQGLRVAFLGLAAAGAAATLLVWATAPMLARRRRR